MGILSQGSYLGELTQRLYRCLQLDGVVSCQVADTVQPVVIVGDGLRPGMGAFRGRSFSHNWEVQNSGFNLSLAAAPGSEGFWVDQVVFGSNTPTLADLVRAYWYPIASVPGGAPATVSTQLTDRVSSSVDFAPILSGANAGAPTASAFFMVQLGVTPIFKVDGLNWFVGPGLALTFRHVTTAGLSVQVMGRTFG